MPKPKILKLKTLHDSFLREKWNLNDKCFAFSHQGWYEARIIAVKNESPEATFKVHFLGWNKNHDVWLPRAKVLDRDAVLEHMKVLPPPSTGKGRRRKRSESFVVVIDATPEEPVGTSERGQGKSGAVSTKGKKDDDNDDDEEEEEEEDEDEDDDEEEEEEEEDDDDDEEEEEEEEVDVDGDKDDGGGGGGKRRKTKVRSTKKTVKQTTKRKQSKKVGATSKRRCAQAENKNNAASAGSASSVSTPPAASPLKFRFPNNLKRQLLTDWTAIQKQQLVPLPRKMNVKEITDRYVRSKLQKNRRMQQLDAAKDFATGIELYFNRTLPRLLLYSFERLQYRDSLSRYEGKQPSELYGAEHLLRLFIKLPDLVALAGIPESDIAPLSDIAADFLQFVNSKRASFFLTTYAKPTAEYLQKSRLLVQELATLARENRLGDQEPPARQAVASKT